MGYFDWTILSDKKDNAIVGIGVSLDDMPIASKTNTIFSHWQCTGMVIGGDSYNMPYIPANAVTARCVPVAVIESSTDESKGAYTTYLDSNENRNWLGYYDLIGSGINGVDNDAAIKTKIKESTSGALYTLYRGLGSNCKTESGGNEWDFTGGNGGRGVYGDIRLDNHRLASYMSKTVTLTDTQKNLLQNGYKLLIQASGTLTVGTREAKTTCYTMGDMSVKEGTDRIFDPRYAAFGTETDKVCFPTSRNESSRADSKTCTATTKTLEITDVNATAFQIQVQFILFNRGSGTGESWARQYGYVKDISYTVIPVKVHTGTAVQEVDLSSISTNANYTSYAGGIYNSNYNGKSGMCWTSAPAVTSEWYGSAYSDIAAIAIKFSHEEKEAIKRSGEAYVEISSTFSVGQVKTSHTDQTNWKGYTYAKFSALDSVVTSKPSSLDYTYSPMAPDESVSYPITRMYNDDPGSGNLTFEWSTAMKTSKRMTVTAGSQGVTAEWLYYFLHDTGATFDHCLIVEELSYKIIYRAGGAHNSDETYYTEDTSISKLTNSVTLSSSSSFEYSIDRSINTGDTRYKTEYQSYDGYESFDAGAGVSYHGSHIWEEWHVTMYGFLTVTLTDEMRAALNNPNKIALVTLTSTYHVGVRAYGSANAFGYSKGEFSGWIGESNVYNDTYRSPAGMISATGFEAASNQTPKYLNDGGTYYTQEIPLTSGQLSNGQCRLSYGWKFSFFNNGGNGCHYFGTVQDIGYSIRIVDKYSGTSNNGYTYTLSPNVSNENELVFGYGAKGSLYTSTTQWTDSYTAMANMKCPWSRIGYRFTNFASNTSDGGLTKTYLAQWDPQRFPLLSKDTFSDSSSHSVTLNRPEWYSVSRGSVSINGNSKVPDNRLSNVIYAYAGDNDYEGFTYDASSNTNLNTQTYEYTAATFSAENQGSTMISFTGNVKDQTATIPAYIKAEVNTSGTATSYLKDSTNYRSGYINGDQWASFDGVDGSLYGIGVSYWAAQQSAGADSAQWNAYTYYTITITNEDILAAIADPNKEVSVEAMSNYRVGGKCGGVDHIYRNQRSWGDNYAYFSGWSGDSLVYNDYAQCTNVLYKRSENSDSYVISEANNRTTQSFILTDTSGKFTLGWHWIFSNFSYPGYSHYHYGLVTGPISYLVTVKDKSHEVKWNLNEPEVDLKATTVTYGSGTINLKNETTASHAATGSVLSYNWNKEAGASLVTPENASSGPVLKEAKESGVYEVHVRVEVNKAGTLLTSSKTDSAQMTINKMPVSITITSVSKVFGDRDIDCSDWGEWTITAPASLPNGESATDKIKVYNYTSGVASDVRDTRFAGTYEINATAEADNYDITVIKGTLTISRKSVTVIVASNQGKLYKEADPDLIYSIDESAILGLLGEDKDDVISVTREAGEDYKEGGYAIIVSVKPEFENFYSVSANSQKFVIRKRSATVTIEGKEKFYGENDPVYTWKVGDNDLAPGDVKENVISVTNITREKKGTTEGEKVGYYTFSADISSTNYDITESFGSLRIKQRVIYVTFESFGKVYGESDSAPYAWDIDESRGTLALGDELEDVVVFQNTFRAVGENVGTYAISGTLKTDECNKNYDIKIVSGTLTITQRPITIKINDVSKIYGQEDSSLAYSYTIKEGELASFDKVPGVVPFTIEYKRGTNQTGEDVGEYTLLGVTSGNNYNVTVETGKLKINPRTVNVKIKDATKQYGFADPDYEWDISETQPANGGLTRGDTKDVITLSDFTRDNNENVGTYEISATGSATNYNVIVSGGSFLTIEKRQIEYGITVTGLTYDEENDCYYAIYGDSVGTELTGPEPAIPSGDTINVNIVLSKTVKNVGDYTVGYKIIYESANSGNYEITVNQDITAFSVRPCPVSITLADADKTYGANDNTVAVDWALTSGYGMKYGENAQDKLTASNLQRLNADNVGEDVKTGGYKFTASFTSELNNYDVIEVIPATLTINPKAVTVSVEADTKVYGASEPDYAWSVVGLVNGDTEEDLEFSVTRAEGEDVGTYLLSGEALNPNYSVTVTSSTVLTITVYTVAFDITNGSMKKDLYTAATLPDPNSEEIGAFLAPHAVLPNDDIIEIEYGYLVSKDTVVAADVNASGWDYIYAEVHFKHSETGTTGEADGNYVGSYGSDHRITIKLVVNEGNMFIDMSSIALSYDFHENGGAGIDISIASVKVKLNNNAGAEVEDASLTARITSADGSATYFADNGAGSINVTYVPSVNKNTTSIVLSIWFEAEKSGYNKRIAHKDFTLNKEVLSLAITFAPVEEEYNGLPKTANYTDTLPSCLTAAVTYTGDRTNVTAEGANATLTYDLKGHKAAGDNRTYYSHVLPASVTTTVKVTPAPVTITAKDQSAEYTGARPVPSSTADDYIVSGTVFGNDDLGVTVTIDDSAEAKVGNYTLNVTISNTNYNPTYVSGNFEVKPKKITLSLKPSYSEKEYGSDDPSGWYDAENPDDFDPSLIFLAQGIIEGESIALAIAQATREAGEDVGDYAINITMVTGTNYEISADNPTLAFHITPKDLTVGFVEEALTKVYDGNAVTSLSAASVLTVKGGSLAALDTGKTLADIGLTVTIETENIKDVGTYKDAVKGNAASVINYNVRWESDNSTHDFSITKRKVRISIAGKQVYYGNNLPLTCSLATQPENCGLVGDDQLEDIVVLTREGGAEPIARKHLITASDAEGSNYSVEATNTAYYNVLPHPITVNVADKQKEYGKEMPAFTWEIVGGEASLSYGQKADVLKLTLNLTDGLGIYPGEYTIGGTYANNNYDITLNTGKLTVIKATPVIDTSGIVKDYVYTGVGFRISEGATHNNSELNPVEGLIYPDKTFRNVSDGGDYEISLEATEYHFAATAVIHITISKAELSFDWDDVDTSFEYTGEEQSITGVRIKFRYGDGYRYLNDGTEIIYENNTFVEIPEEGAIDVTVTVEGTENFDGITETRHVVLAHSVVDMSGIDFADATYVFNGQTRTLKITGELPNGVKQVTYSQNELTHVGRLIVTAHFEVLGNFDAVADLVAELKIIPRPVNIEIIGAVMTYGDTETKPFTWPLSATQTMDDTADIVAQYPLDISVTLPKASNSDEFVKNAGIYTPVIVYGESHDYAINIVSSTDCEIKAREITVKLADEDQFTSEYDGLAKSVAINEYATIIEGTLAPWHESLGKSGAIRAVMKNYTIRNVGVYEGAITFVAGSNYDVTFVGKEDGSLVYDFTVTARNITVELNDQEIISDIEIDHGAYIIKSGALVKGDKLQLVIRKGEMDDSGKYILLASSGNANYIVTVENVAHITYVFRAEITVNTPYDLVYDGNIFSLNASINSTSPLIFTINGVVGKNEFVDPGHYEVVISAEADATLKAPIPVTVTFNINPVELKLVDGDTDITISSERGFLYGDPLAIKHEQGRTSDSEIVGLISGEFTIVDGYVFRIGVGDNQKYIGEYIQDTNSQKSNIRIKVPAAYAERESIECIVIRDGVSEKVEVAVNDGFIELGTEGLQAMAFIAERQTVIALVIIAAIMGIVGLFMAVYYIFRRKSY